MNLKEEFKNNRKYYYGLFSILFIIVCCLIGTVIGNKQTEKLNTFASQLLDHSAPEGSRVATTATGTNKGKAGTESYACVILQSDLPEEELLAYYTDITYAPARNGNVATLRVYPIQDKDLETLKSSQYYQEEGGSYWYIYLYSATP